MIAEINFKMKKFKDRFLAPICLFFQKIGLTANILSAFNVFFGLLAAIFLYEDQNMFIVFLGLSLLFDVFDGTLARIEKKTDDGWIIDTLADRILMTMIIIKSIWIFESTISLVALIAYTAVHGLIIYEKIAIKQKSKIIFLDFFVYILFIVQSFNYAIYSIICISAIHFLEFAGQFFFRPRYE